MLKRMSQATTEVAPSSGDREVPSSGTVEMTVEDSDDDDEEWDPDVSVFDPAESDNDSVLDALQRDLEADVGPDQSSRTMYGWPFWLPFLSNVGNFKDVRFYTILNFGLFCAAL